MYVWWRLDGRTRVRGGLDSAWGQGGGSGGGGFNFFMALSV